LLEIDWTRSVAWGDYDGDGDLDLAAGNDGQPNRLYRNDGGVLTSSAVWSSIEADRTRSVAWGDYDGDGDLDLVVGNVYQPKRLYRNDNGVLADRAIWSSVEADLTESVAWGDYDGDGDLDLASGNVNQRNRIYRNTRNSFDCSMPLCADSLPSVTLARPMPPGNANFYSAPAIWPASGSTIRIHYVLKHPASWPVAHIRAYYSPDGGGRWLPAAAAPGTPATSSR